MEVVAQILANSIAVWSVIGIVVGVGTRILDKQEVKGGIIAAAALERFKVSRVP